MKKFLFAFLLLGCIVLTLYLGKAPNLDLHFYRMIPSQLEPNRLDRNIRSVTRWPQWFHSLEKASSADSKEIHPGSLVKLKINSHSMRSKPFELIIQVIDYIPTKKLHLRVISDSSEKLTRLFDRLEWMIQILPDSHGSRIVGTGIAHTQTWKARLFGKISEKILMNQVFYPDLIQLAELRQPFSADLDLKALGIGSSN